MGSLPFVRTLVVFCPGDKTWTTYLVSASDIFSIKCAGVILYFFLPTAMTRCRGLLVVVVLVVAAIVDATSQKTYYSPEDLFRILCISISVVIVAKSLVTHHIEDFCQLVSNVTVVSCQPNFLPITVVCSLSGWYALHRQNHIDICGSFTSCQLNFWETRETSNDCNHLVLVGRLN